MSIDGGSGDSPLAQIDSIMHAYQGEVPGASVLVIHSAREIVRRCYGCADLESRTTVTPATNFRLASITKQFTAAAILLLAQEGRLTLDDAVHHWLPSLPDRRITIRQLLAHTSGLIDYEDLIPTTWTHQLHDQDVLRLIEAQTRSYFAPGSAYRYSNGGYALLSLIVARASGASFASFLRDRIFFPLGMQGSIAYEEGISRVARRAFGYSRREEQWVCTDQSLTSATLGDGGIYSSSEDLAKWDAALDAPGILSAESLRLAFTAATSTDDPCVRYALGWRITGESIWHSGETLGFRHAIVRWPKRHFTVIVLSNRNAPEAYSLALAIAKLFFADADVPRASQVVVGPDSAQR
jgi:CubicO group peptidase (beta-lactamase class C family)